MLREKTNRAPRRSVFIRHRVPRTDGRHGRFPQKRVSDRLYVIGMLIERRRENFFRSFRKQFKLFFFGITRAVAALFGAIGRSLSKIRQDITRPFQKARRSYKSLSVLVQSEKKRGRRHVRERMRLFFKYGWMGNKHLVGRLLSYLLPMFSLLLCAVVIIVMINMNYALRVSYNSETVGYIESESVYSSARTIIHNRLISGDDTDILQKDTVLSIAILPLGERVATQEVMAESLLGASGSEIAEATGIFIGGTLYGATTAPAILEQKLEELRAPFYSIAEQLGEDATVRFAREVELQAGIYPVSSILPVDALIERVASPQTEDIYFTAKGGEPVAEIALKNGISANLLIDMNPGIEGAQAAQAGQQLLVARDEALLRVKTVRVSTSTESVGYDTIRHFDDTMSNRNYQLIQSGVPGERTIVKELEYDVNGSVVFENVIRDEVTTPPIHQEVIVGTLGVESPHTATQLVWPTGSDYQISRGFRAVPEGMYPRHLGVDIAAGTNTPLYAANGGVVITALYTDVGYGHYIIIDHEDGMITVYGHCNGLFVNVGDRVSRGQVIAQMGSTGNSTGSHLHFEVRINGEHVDPAPFIGLAL